MLDAVQENATFAAILQKSESLSQKWTVISQMVIDDVRERFDVDIDESDVRKIQQARYITVSNDELDSELYESQLEKIPQLKEYFTLKKLRENDAETRKNAQAELLDIKNPRARMVRARELGLEHSPLTTEPSGLNKEDTMALLLTLPAKLRIQMGRRWGVIG